MIREKEVYEFDDRRKHGNFGVIGMVCMIKIRMVHHSGGPF